MGRLRRAMIDRLQRIAGQSTDPIITQGLLSVDPCKRLA
jgi:hypothetical protein